MLQNSEYAGFASKESVRSRPAAGADVVLREAIEPLVEIAPTTIAAANKIGNGFRTLGRRATLILWLSRSSVATVALAPDVGGRGYQDPSRQG
jgi:hypothetical protein